MSTITLNKGGAAEKVVDVMSLEVPDLWNIAMYLAENGQHDSSEKVIEAWHLAHSMKCHIQEGGAA